MGSLMSGWDSPVLDPEVAKYHRNKSYTRGEIEAFWRSQREKEDGSSAESSPRAQATSPAAKRYQRSSSMPLPGRRMSVAEGEEKSASCVVSETDNTVTTTSCWWTRSNWAFLNEYPVMETEGSDQRKHGSSKNCATFWPNPKFGGDQRIST